MRRSNMDGMIDSEGCLHCQGCGGHNLHHRKVSVFRRFAEDSDDGLCCHFNGLDSQHPFIISPSVAISTDLNGNPSSRRGGVLVEFFCENCATITTVSILQHKGSEFIEFNGKDGSITDILDILASDTKSEFAKALHDLKHFQSANTPEKIAEFKSIVNRAAEAAGITLPSRDE